MRQHPLSRRALLLWGAAASVLGRRADAGSPEPPKTWRGAVVQPDEGELFIAGRRRALVRIKVDSTRSPGATMSVVVSEVSPGASIPVHLHQNEDELIFVHRGSGKVTIGEQLMPAATGAILYAPRGVWHGVENTSNDTLIWCAIYSPPGFEQYFRETGVPAGSTAPPLSAEQVAAAAKKYGMVFKSP